LAVFHVAWEEDEASDLESDVMAVRLFLDRVDCALCGLWLQRPDELVIAGAYQTLGSRSGIASRSEGPRPVRRDRGRGRP